MALSTSLLPRQPAMVLMRGPIGEFEVPFDEAAFGGPARKESRNYGWAEMEPDWEW